MKKNYLWSYSLVALFLLCIACNSEDVNFEFNEKSSAQQTTCEDAKIVTLIAGQHIDAGTVTVTNDEENLYVTYQTNDDWSISETHLYVGPEEDIPQTRSGNPKIGHFPYHGDNNDPFVIPLSDLNDCFVIVAHAVVNKIVDGEIKQSETAFGCGDKEFSGKRWGCYFEYCKKDCEVEKECVDAKGLFYKPLSLCFSEGGFSEWGWTNLIKFIILDEYQNNNGKNWQMPLYINEEGEQCTEQDKIQIGYIELNVFYDADNNNLPSLSAEYILTDSSYELSEVSFYFGFDKYPTDSEGNFTTSPEYYTYKVDNLDGNDFKLPTIAFDKEKLGAYSYFIPHAKVCKTTM